MTEELAEAVQRAEASPMPDPTTALGGVYAEGGRAELWARDLSHAERTAAEVQDV